MTIPLLAHGAHAPGGAEAELLAMGLGLLLLSFLFRPSQVGRRQPMIVTIVMAVALLAAAFIMPRL